MHTIKITPNLLIEYQCTSGKFIRLPNRIEKNGFRSENRIELKLFLARIGMLYCTVKWACCGYQWLHRIPLNKHNEKHDNVG